MAWFALVAWILLVPAVLGVLTLRCIGIAWRDDRMAFVGWAWLAGCFTLGASLYLFLEAGIPPQGWFAAPLFAVLVLASLGRFVVSRHDTAHVANAQPAAAAVPASRILQVFVAAGVVFLVVHAVSAGSRPCLEADEGNIWALRSKSLVLDWPAGMFREAQVWNPHPDYPLLNPLLQAWVLSQFGEVVHFENRLLVQLCAPAAWLSLCAALRARVPQWLAIGLAAIVLTSDEFVVQARLAYADGMVAFGLLVALDGFLRWRETGRTAFCWLAALGGAFAIWSKNEALAYAAITAVAALATVRWKRLGTGGIALRRWLPLLLPVGVVVVQLAFNLRFGLRNDLLGANWTGQGVIALAAEHWRERLPVLAGRALGALFSPTLAAGAFLAVFAAALVRPSTWMNDRPTLLLPLVALGGSLAALHLVWLGTHSDLIVHLDTSYHRVLFQLLPAAVVLLAAILRAATAASTDVLATRGEGSPAWR